MDMGTGGGPAQVVLAELALFWAATVLHMLRLLSSDRLPGTDRLEEAGHMAMGAGMTVMVFPGVPADILRAFAAAFAVLAVGYLVRAVYRRDPARHRVQNAAVGAGLAATAYLLTVPAHQPAWLPGAVAAVLAVCVLAHGARLTDARHRAVEPGTSAMLVTLSHVGTLVTTAAMAWMAAAA